MASTVERLTKFRGEPLNAAEFSVIKASSTILKGTVAMQVAGVASTYAPTAGCVLLGIAETTTKNSTGGNVTLSRPMIFKRGYCYLMNSQANPVVVGDIGKVCPLEDEDTVKTGAVGANDLSVTVLGIVGSEVLCLVGP